MTLQKLIKRASNLPTIETIDAEKAALVARLATADVENLRRKIAMIQLRIDNSQREAKRFGEMAKDARSFAFDGKKLVDAEAASVAAAFETVAQRYNRNVKDMEKEIGKLRASLQKAHNVIVANDAAFTGVAKSTVIPKSKSELADEPAN